MINTILLLFALVVIAGGFGITAFTHTTSNTATSHTIHVSPKLTSSKATVTPIISSPLAVTKMREKSYPGSTITIEQTLTPGSNYQRYVVSYTSDGLKIYGLLTVPVGTKPAGGWPVILFNHGYIPPSSYATTSSYAVMVDPLAAAGYIVFMPDYHGNGNSEGNPQQPYVSPDYVTDSMNALASVTKYKDANPKKIGVFGHSMGGDIALHELVMTHAIKAAELMAGVVGDERGLEAWWNHRFAVHSIVGNDLDTYYAFEQMIKNNGTPETNPNYWNEIDPTQFLNFITAPVEIQVGTADEEVPVTFSTTLRDSLQKEGKTVAFHQYSGADHNLSPDLSSAMAESVIFFNKYLQ